MSVKKHYLTDSSREYLCVCNVDEEGRFGGPERRIVQVAKALFALGVHTHIIYPVMDSERFSKYIRKNKINATQMNLTRLSKEPKVLIKYAFFFIAEILRLANFFHSHKFDLIHVNGSYQFKVAIAAKLAKTKVVWHLNDTMMNKFVKKIFEYVAAYCSTGFIVAGERVRDYYLKDTYLERLPCQEIHAPVDTKLFSQNILNYNTHHDRIGPNHMINIVTVSGLNPTKGLEYFVEMASLLYKLDKRIRFKIAGAELTSHQKYAANIKAMVNSSDIPTYAISFLGMVDDVPALLNLADICVFTSVSEASPTSVWEALSMGKPVVTTDVGSVKQYIKNGYSGFIVPPYDVNGLVEKTLILIQNPGLRTSFGVAARKLATESLDIAFAAQLHAQFYTRIVCRD